MSLDVIEQINAFGRWGQQNQLYLLGAAATLPILAAVAAVRQRQRAQQSTHGSARWGSRHDARKAGLLGPDGVVLGKLGRDILRHNGPEHILVVGPTRSGKGVSTIIPTLLTWPESTIVLDPKDGENYDITAKWRVRKTVTYAFTPCKAPHTKINVLDTIRLGTRHEVGDATLIAQSLTAPAKLHGEGSTSVHFRELAALLLTAAILHVCYTSARRSLAGVWQFLTQEHGSLSESLTAMTTTAHREHGVHTAVVSMTRAIQNITGDRELSSVWSTAIRPLVLYSDPYVAASTDSSDFPFERLQYGQYPVSLYLIAPSPMALERLHPLYRVILDVAMTRLMERKVRTWRHRLLNCFDELPWYGYCRAVDKGIAVQAGYGQKNLLITQDLDALLEVYGAHTAIFGNCHVKVWHTPDNDLTAKRLSENLLGRSTVPTQGMSTTGGMFGRRSVSTHDVGRPLLTTDEVMRLPATQEIVHVGGLWPLLADKLDYREEAQWRHRWEA